MKRILYFCLFLALGHLHIQCVDESNLVTRTVKSVWNTGVKASTTVKDEVTKAGKQGYNLCVEHKFITATVGAALIVGAMYKYCTWFRKLFGLEEDDSYKNFMPFGPACTNTKK